MCKNKGSIGKGLGNSVNQIAPAEAISPRLEVIKLFSCSTQLSTKFQLLVKTKIPTKKFLAFSLSDVVFIMLINVKMPTIVGLFNIYKQDKFRAQLS